LTLDENERHRARTISETSTVPSGLTCSPLGTANGVCRCQRWQRDAVRITGAMVQTDPELLAVSEGWLKERE
jgi:hypothetical protein